MAVPTNHTTTGQTALCRTFGPATTPPIPIIWVILAAYVFLIADITLWQVAYGELTDCFTTTPFDYSLFAFAHLLLGGLVLYVAAYGRWRVVWLSPQVVLLVAAVLIVAGGSMARPDLRKPGEMCFVTT